MPLFLATLTSSMRAFWYSLASVGKVMFFFCTVVSTLTWWNSAGFAAPFLLPREWSQRVRHQAAYHQRVYAICPSRSAAEATRAAKTQSRKNTANTGFQPTVAKHFRHSYQKPIWDNANPREDGAATAVAHRLHCEWHQFLLRVVASLSAEKDVPKRVPNWWFAITENGIIQGDFVVFSVS